MYRFTCSIPLNTPNGTAVLTQSSLKVFPNPSQLNTVHVCPNNTLHVHTCSACTVHVHVCVCKIFSEYFVSLVHPLCTPYQDTLGSVKYIKTQDSHEWLTFQLLCIKICFRVHVKYMYEITYIHKTWFTHRHTYMCTCIISIFTIHKHIKYLDKYV